MNTEWLSNIVFLFISKKAHMKNYKYMTCTVGVMLQQLNNSCSRCRKGRGRQNLHPDDIWRRNCEMFFEKFQQTNIGNMSRSINNKAYYCIFVRWKQLPHSLGLALTSLPFLCLLVCQSEKYLQNFASVLCFRFYVSRHFLRFPAIFLHFFPPFLLNSGTVGGGVVGSGVVLTQLKISKNNYSFYHCST